MFTRAWHFSPASWVCSRRVCPVREQMARRAGKDYQHGGGRGSVTQRSSTVKEKNQESENEISVRPDGEEGKGENTQLY